uniref:G-protein coupled receptors family 1 profile domain-containing protein n=1 Tax=Romanomermis culicivorax TaxID=13658 RepID=A0A915J3Z6_ROMCU
MNANMNMNVSQHYSHSINFYYLPLGLLSLMAIFGNLMVIVSVIVEKRLRALATNHFVASLALSDLLVGALVMPFGVYIKMNNNSWDLGRTWCQFHLSSTVFSTAASILNLVAISIDRRTSYTLALEDLHKVQDNIRIGYLWPQIYKF